MAVINPKPVTDPELLTDDELAALNSVEGAAYAARQYGGPFASFVESPAKRAYLVAFALTGSNSEAAKAARVDETRDWCWKNREGDEEDREAYREAFELARSMAVDRVEGGMFDRSINGVERMKFHRGKPIMDPRTGAAYVEREYPEQTAALLMKAHKPEKYHRPDSVTNIAGESITVDIHGRGEEDSAMVWEAVRDKLGGNGHGNGNGNGRD